MRKIEESKIRLQLFNKERVYLAVIQDITERRSAGEKLAWQLHELQRWHQLMLNREERVMELKREVNELLAHYGQHPRYHSVDKGKHSTASINKPLNNIQL
ncbi:MAG: hypothetical protein ACOZDD_01425 [Bacteroidota bacterium]